MYECMVKINVILHSILIHVCDYLAPPHERQPLSQMISEALESFVMEAILQGGSMSSASLLSLDREDHLFGYKLQSLKNFFCSNRSHPNAIL